MKKKIHTKAAEVTKRKKPIILTRKLVAEWTVDQKIRQYILYAHDIIPLLALIPDCLAPFIGSNAPIGKWLQGSTWTVEFKTELPFKLFELIDFEGRQYTVEKVETVWSHEPSLSTIKIRHESDEPRGFYFVTKEIENWFHGRKKAA